MKAIILGSGSKGNSTLLITDNKKILIDVGFSYPKTKMLLENNKYSLDDIDFILITHEHKDHISGLASIVKHAKKNVYIPSPMFKAINKIVDSDYIVTIDDDKFQIDDVSIRFLHTSHDALYPVGFLIEDTRSLVYMTDTGYISKNNLEYMKDKDLYIIESNHDPKMLMNGPYPYVLKQRVVSDTGHLSNEMTGKYLKNLIGRNTKKIILAHLSETNNLEELALQTVNDIIESRVEVEAARQNESMMVEI
ncbi:MAG: MBL fold metallo-hydrolase [Bacilli bacterium]|nr:MBL fold metallo-hydrolase [Bacilli bacterium]